MSKKDTCISPGVTWFKDQNIRLPAVDRALSLFELLANSQHGLTLSELSRKLIIPKSTTHCLIYTLFTRGYLQRSSDGRHFVPGIHLAKVAGANTAELNLKELAMPYLRKMSSLLNLTAIATVRRGAQAVIIAKVESFQDRGGGAWIGRHFDLHCTAQGKALISALSDEKLDKLFGCRDLAPFTPKTIASLTSLKTHLALVRTNGFAVNDEEQVFGIRAVAAPVTDSEGTVVAAFSVRGSTDQISRARFPMMGREVLLLSQEFSSELRQ